jgi:autotransporter-associated beta strand protein
LRYIGGANSSTNRPLRLLGSTGGATLDSSGSGTISFTSATFGTPGAGTKTLTLTGANTGLNTIAGIIADNSAANKTAVAKSGSGTWQLTGNNTFTSAITITGGTLLVNGAHSGAGAVSATGGGALGTGGTLGGTGAIPGTITISASNTTPGLQGGAVYPGNGGATAGTLNVGSMIWNPLGRYVFAHDATNNQTGGGVNNFLNGTGTLDLENISSGSPFDISLRPIVFSPTTPSPTAYTIATFAGGIAGFNSASNQFFPDQTILAGPGSTLNLFTFSGTTFSGSAAPSAVVSGAVGGTQSIVVTFTPVPEPAFVLAACGLTALVARRRLKRRAVSV